MAGPSKELHSAETLRFLAERLARISASFTELSLDYEKHVGAPLVVLKDDQRKRALEFLDRFFSEAKQSLTRHLEETGRYKAAAPATAKELGEFAESIGSNSANRLTGKIVEAMAREATEDPSATKNPRRRVVRAGAREKGEGDG